MNYFQYKEAEKNKVKGIRYWANKCRKIQKTLEYNPDPNATVRHHLRDTEEQRKYNDEHYEYFGFNQDGSFEYGKYIIFVTEEEHTAIHKVSEETRRHMCESQRIRRKNTVVSEETKKKISESNKGRPGMIGENHPMYGKHHSDESKKKMSDAIKANPTSYWKGKSLSEEHRRKLSESGKGKHSGENNGMYGKHLSEEQKRKMGESLKAAWTDELRKRQSEKFSGENAPMYGKHHSEEAKKKISDSHKGKPSKLKDRPRPDDVVERISESKQIMSDAYHKYKSDGGTMSWNDFQKHYKLNKENIENE